MEGYVLAFAFFAAVFSTMTWFIYILMYVNDKLGTANFSQLGVLDFTIYLAIILLPILILWMVFGYINQYFNFTNLSKNSQILYQQMKKNLDYTDVVARILLETEQEIKSSFVLNKFELFISDMNELLADVIQRGSLASSEQIDRLWHKVRDGGKWAFGKVVIEINANQPNFSSRLIAKTVNDTVLGGTILEFCARYQNLLKVLEKHDKEKVFLSVIETGVYGKVYSILAPIGEQIQKSRIDLSEECGIKISSQQTLNVSTSRKEAEQRYIQGEKQILSHKKDEDFIEEPVLLQEKAKSFMNIFNPFKFRRNTEHSFDDKEPVFKEGKDPFSEALERSFGSSPSVSDNGVWPETENSHHLMTDTFTSNEEQVQETPLHTFNSDKDDEGMPAPSIRNYTDSFQEDTLSAKFETNKEGENQSFFNTHKSSFDVNDEIGFTNTRKTLNSLKKEWQEMKSSQEQHSFRQAPQFLRRDLPENTDASLKDEEYAYPFGGWSDVENYDKR